MPPRKAETKPRAPADFEDLLAATDPLLLVGGQAVNLWALLYPGETSDLAPFVSTDVDVLGTKETLLAIGRNAGIKPQFFPFRPPSNEIGVIASKDKDGFPRLVEVLRSVHGVTNEDLNFPSYTVALGKTHVRIPGPIALLQGKISNLADIRQTGRRDAHHLQILDRVIPAYLADLQQRVSDGHLTERQLINSLERLLAIVTAPKARRVLKKFRIERETFFRSLSHSKLPKVVTFFKRRLPRYR